MTTATIEIEPPQALRGIDRLRRSAYIWAPLLILFILSAPSISSLLPATQDYLDEIYQPLRALKFFSSHGRAFHKYGPMENFILAPSYGASLLYWKLTGTFAHPTETFPYGFAHPFQQMGFLILQSRIIFLLIGLIGFASLAQALTSITADRIAIAFALIFGLATNYILVYELPTARPDSPMLGFSALALACYVRMAFDRFTIRRGIWMSLFAVCAVSSKELAASMFILPYLGLIILAARNDRGKNLRVMAYAIAAGILAYLLLNVVYAPHTWLSRMKYWLGGPGIDADVWGHGSRWSRALALLNNFGPAGSLVVIVSIVALLLIRPRRWLMLLLPAISVSFLGLARIDYPADRFYTILCLALLPAIAPGLAVLISPSRGGSDPLRRLALIGCLITLAVINFTYATLAWFELRSTFEASVESHAIAHVPRTQSVYTLNEYPYNPGSTRLEYLGYHHDSRSIQQIASLKVNLPDWIYTTEGKLGFLDDARRFPARAALLDSDKRSPFDIRQWHGLEGLGYQLDQKIVPAVPVWYPFNWMPSVRQWKQRKTLLVYRLRQPLSAQHSRT